MSRQRLVAALREASERLFELELDDCAGEADRLNERLGYAADS